MTKTLWTYKIVVAVLLLAAASSAQKLKSAYKLTHLSSVAAAVACVDGSDPEVERLGNVLIVTCHPILVAGDR